MNDWVQYPLVAWVGMFGTADHGPAMATTAAVATTALMVGSSAPKKKSDCPPSECGRNSAHVETYPLDALDLDGRVAIPGPNGLEGFKIIRARAGSWKFRITNKRYKLDVNAYGELVVKRWNTTRPVDRITIAATVPGPESNVLKKYHIILKDPKALRSWAMAPGCNYKEDLESFPDPDCFEVSYQPRVIGVNNNAEGPVCEGVTGWDHQGPRFGGGGIIEGKGMLGSYEIDRWHEPTNRAVLVKGEVYDHVKARVRDDVPPARWFNFACAGSAIGKMKLMGYDPAETRPEWKTSKAQRQATLKMITASYCEAASEYAFTVSGQALGFQNREEWMWPWTKIKIDDKAIEARWNEHGATCLNRPRSTTWRYKNKLDLIQEVCGPLPKCQDFLPEPTKTPPTSTPPAAPGTVQDKPKSDPIVWDNTTEDQEAARESFEGVLSADEEWMTFSRYE